MINKTLETLYMGPAFKATKILQSNKNFRFFLVSMQQYY